MESNPSESDCSKSERLSEKRTLEDGQCDEFEDFKYPSSKKAKTGCENEPTGCDLKAGGEGSVVAKPTDKATEAKPRTVSFTSKKNKASNSKKKAKLTVKGEKSENEVKNGTQTKDKPKGNMRRNIREILKEEELEAETRAAQKRELERIQRLQHQQQQIEANYSSEFDIPGEDNSSAAALVDNLHALAKELEDSNLSPESPIPLTDETHDILAVSPSEHGSTTKPTIAAKKVVDDDDIIYLSSDEEDVAPKSKPPVPIQPQHIVCEDDDDVVILSDDDEKKDAADDDDGDVNNFGLHTRDEFNRPDAQGRVLVNVGHPQNESDIFLAPQLARAVKTHQIGGIRFLYDNVVENLEQFSTSPGFGCILAHSMGLGKTFQVCAFCDVFLRHTKAKTVLIIVPINTIQNWVSEFNSWLPAEQNVNCTPEDLLVQPRSFILHVLNDATKDLNSRFKVINDWMNQGGVLLMGYEMYRLFYTQRESREKKRVSKKKKAGVVDLEEEEKEKGMIEQIFQALVNPGPELVICDEGHRIKNMKASISVALKEIRTRRRVVLTGYPLQNNLLEYWCMVDFVRPSFLGTRPEFSNAFERPIQNGQCVDSSPADVKLMKERVYVLHSLVKGFVQRRSHTVLRASLPHKEEHVLLLRLTPLQRALYRHHMSQLVQNKSVCNPLRAFAICLKIWNHPDVLYNFFKKGLEDLDLDLDEEMSDSRKKKKTTTGAKVPPVANSANVQNEEDGTETGENSNTTVSLSQTPTPVPKDSKKDDFSTIEWAYDLMKDYVPGDIDSAAKTRIFFTILEESIKLGDRMLVFSQSLFTLDMLEEFLQQRVIPGKNEERWAKNRSYFRLDGSTSGMEREKLVNDFNANPDVLLFLISTRAGSLGINLIGANRVVVFDASWNPCHDAQAVCRVYRYGQQKQCFIYRLVTDNSLEKKIYNRQIGKQGTSDRVVDELNPEARLTLRDVTTLVCDNEEDPPLFDFGKHHNQKDLKDLVLQAVLKKWGTSFTKDPFQHDALLAESKESKLSKAEKRMAQRLYEKAKLDGTMQYRRQNYSTYYPKTSLPVPNLGFTGSYGNSFGQNNSHPPYPSIRPHPNLQLNIPPSSGMDLLTEALNQGKLVCKEMLLNKDVTISRSQVGGNSNELVPVVLPAGTRVKLIKTPKGIYMQTPEGKIFRIHSSSHAPHGSPSSMASLLGIGHKPQGSLASDERNPQRNNDDQRSPQIDPAMLRRIIDAQTSGEMSPDKNAALAQMLQRSLNGSKGLDGSTSSAISGPGGRNLPFPDNPNLSHFAKQLAALAQRSTTDGMGLKGTSSSNGASSTDGVNNGLTDSSSKRSSSILDPKARALPSASLPKKAPATPNLSRARSFVPSRPAVSNEPGVTSSDRTGTNNAALFYPSSSSGSLSEAIRTESSSLPTVENLPNVQPNVVDLTEANDFEGSSSGGSSNSGGSGLFDNLSLASQLEGFASGSTEGKAEATGSLRDLLKTSNGASNPPPSTSQWNNDSSVMEKNQSNPAWLNFTQWNAPSWNNGASSHSGWQWGSQPAEQGQLSGGASQSMGQPSVFGNSNSQSAPTTDVSSSSQSYTNYSESYRQTDQWSNFSSLPSASTASSNSTAYPSHSQYTNFYPPSHYDYNNGTFNSFTPSTQTEFAPVGNYPNFSGHGSNSYTPGFPQPYPGSFSQ